MRRIALVVSLGFILQGCYNYVPVSVADLTPDMEVRAEITPAARDALADVLPGDDRTLDGTVISTEGNQLLLQVEAVNSQSGIRLESLDQRVHVDKAGVLEVHVKERDKAKTIGLSALITAGVIAIAYFALESGGANEQGDLGPGGPQDALIPLLRIPIGR